MINISSDIVNIIVTNVASIIQQLWVLFAVLIALTITFWVARRIIFLFILAKR